MAIEVQKIEKSETMAANQDIPGFLMVKDTSKDITLNFRKALVMIAVNWWLYIGFLVLFIAMAFLYIRYSTPQYNIHAKILVKDKKKGGNVFGPDLFSEFSLLDNGNSVDNEVELLKSRTLMEKTLAQLNLNIDFFVRGKVKTSEVYYRSLPFAIEMYDLNDDSLRPLELNFEKISSDSFRLDSDLGTKIHRYGDTVEFPFAKLLFTHSQNFLISPYNEVLLTITGTDQTVSALREQLNVAVTNKTVSTIDITFSDPIPKRGEEIVNTLLFIYDQMNKEDKNRVADSTIQFIDDRLKIVVRELGEVENQIQTFRQSNELTDISTQGKLLLDNSSEYLKELTAQDVQIEVVSSLEEYLLNDKNESRLVPTSLTIQDPTLMALVDAYNTAQLERDRQLQTVGSSNPILRRLDVEIPNLKNDILSTLSTIKRGMTINRDELKTRSSFIDSKIKLIPSKERTFLEFSRQQNIKQELYLYLLKKREETAVSKSANVDNTRIIDAAKADSRPYKPRTQIIYASFFLLGILVPSVLLSVKKLLSTKISEKADILEKTDATIVAEIGHNTTKDSLVVQDGSRSVLGEQFRALRTNLQFLLPGKEQKSILVTSSMSGEGKSFVSVNLASSIALSGKRVALMEMDLRKPNVSNLFGFSNRLGFSNFIVGNCEISDILVPTEINSDLVIIPSGPLPPNPSELIMSPNTKRLFDLLKEQFDYIVMDTAPVGLVTDAQLLVPYSDLSLFVIRQQYTYKQQLETIDDYFRSGRLGRLNLIVNDIQWTKGNSRGYGGGFGYGYGYSDGKYFSS